MAIVSGQVQLGVSFGGDWTGSYGTPSSGNLQEYQSWWNTGGATGHAIQAVTHFCYPSFTASAFTSPFSQVSSFYNAGGTVIMSLGGFPSGGSVSTLLSGGYDSNIAALGAAMAPYKDLIIRYAWECTGDWFYWSAYNLGVANYQAMWAYTIPRLRAAGFQGLFDFNCETENGLTPLQVAPDPSLYDIASIDKYAVNGDSTRASDWPYCWTTFQRPAFDACAALAARDGKRIGLPEFSTGFKQGGWGCGDDDYYLDQLAAWIQQHDVAYANAFNMNDMSGTTVVNRHMWADAATTNTAGPFSDDSNFPLSIAAWKGATWTSVNLSQTAPTPAPAAKPVRPTERPTRFVY